MAVMAKRYKQQQKKREKQSSIALRIKTINSKQSQTLQQTAYSYLCLFPAPHDIDTNLFSWRLLMDDDRKTDARG